MIDLSDHTSFGAAIDDHLAAGSDLTLAFHQCEAERDAAYERLRSPLQGPNEYAERWTAFREELASLVLEQDILALHYSRMTDLEVRRVLEGGFEPTSLALLRRRLTGQVEEGNLTEEMARTIFSASPLHSERYGTRLDLFWLTCPAVPIASGRVRSLVGEWGGEAANWCLTGEEKEAVKRIGLGRVFSVSVPVSATRPSSAWRIACHIAGLHARSLGLAGEAHGIDLYVTTPIAPGQIIAVVTEGEELFEAHGLETE